MTFAKKFAALFFAFIILTAFSINTFAKLPDLSAWNDCTPYTVLADGGKSNCSIDCIIVKVKSDTEVNQLHMLFMAEQRSFNDEANAGLRVKFNDLGTVELYCNGEEEFDTDTFSAQIDSVASDEASKMLIIEATIGIKSGIPENLIIEFNLFDTDGIASNTYDLDISEEVAPQGLEADDQTDNGDDKDEIQPVEKTKKTKKSSSTKKKSTKTKATSKTKAKNKTGDDNYGGEDAAEIIEANSVDEVKLVNDKKILLTVGATAVTVCLIGGCAAGIINRNRKNGRGEK